MKLPLFWELATTIGEIPSSCIIEIFGFESSGKTSFSLYLYTKAIEQNINCLFLDTELAIRDNYLKLYNIETLPIQYPKHLKEVFEIIGNLKDTMVIWDTLAATPASEELSNVGIAAQSRELSTLLRIYNNKIKTNGIRLLILNQARAPLNHFAEAVAPGGLSLNFYADLKLFFRKKKSEQNLLEVELNTKKNRFGPSGNSSLIIFENGKLSEPATLLRNAVELKILSKKPRGYQYKNLELTEEEAYKLIDEIEEKIREKIKKKRGG